MIVYRTLLMATANGGGDGSQRAQWQELYNTLASELRFDYEPAPRDANIYRF
jgi:hypothetical protein